MTTTSKSSSEAQAGRVHGPFNLKRFLPYRFYALAFRMANSPPSLKDAIAQSGVPISERDWRVLVVIAGHGFVGQTKITQLLGMDPATVTRALRRLEELGLVIRRKGRNDRRTTHVAISKSGARVYDAVAPLRRSFEERLLQELGDKDTAELQRILDRLDGIIANIQDEALEESF